MDTEFSVQDIAAVAKISSIEMEKSKQEKNQTKVLPNDDHDHDQISRSDGGNHDYDDVEKQTNMKDLDVVEVIDYSRRAQWLRAAVLGANDGLLSTASLMMGVGAVRSDVKTMILTGIAGLVGGSCSMALGEYVSVYSQADIELAQLKRELRTNNITKTEYESKRKDLPSPFQAAFASALSFAAGALIPLLSAAFIKSYHPRLAVVVATVTLALIGFGGLGAYLGKAPLVKSSLRVLIGGWLAMGITFGITKLIGKTGV